MRYLNYLIAAISLSISSIVAANGNLEVPANQSAQSGISVISGWHCSANKIEVSIDGGTRIAAAYGTARDDTQSVCGDKNNGWSLLYFYGLFGTGWHTAEAYADGVKFGSSQFYVNDFTDGKFLTGASGVTTVKNITPDGRELVLQWQQAQQGFSVVNRVTDWDNGDSTGVWQNAATRLTVNFIVEREANASLEQRVQATSIFPYGGDTILWLGRFVSPNRMYLEGIYSHLGFARSAAVYVDITSTETAVITVDYCYDGPNGSCGVTRGQQIPITKMHPIPD